jgi:cell division protein FtsB
MNKTALLMVLFVLVLSLAVGVNVKIIQDRKDIKDLQTLTNIEQDKRIEALEKEVRMLKTDLQVLKYGFKEDEE